MKWFFRMSKEGFDLLLFFLMFPIFLIFTLLIGPYSSSILVVLGIPALLTYLSYKSLWKLREIVEKTDKERRKELISSTDMSALCLDMLEAVQQKHRYTNYEAKLETYSDWMAFQVMNGNHQMLGDVAEGINPSKLDEIVKNSFLASTFEGQRGAYDKTINEDDKEKAQSVIVTFDNAFVYRNKFVDWLLNHNWLIVNLFRPAAFIEINLLSQINLMKDVFDHVQIRIKMSTKAMSRRGSEVAEVRFTLDNKDEPNFEEIIMMHAPFFSFTEKEMEDSDTVEVINFMKKFIKKTRKLVR